MKTIVNHQGDVFLAACGQPKGKLVETARGTAETPLILAHGEHTGHSHALHGRAVMFREDGGGGGAYVQVLDRTAELRHQEHAPQEVRQGWHRVLSPREYSEQEIRRVQD